MANTITAEKLVELAENPLEAEEDGVRFKGHSLKELIAMDKYLAGRQAATNGYLGLRFTLLSPPGSTAST